MFLDTEKQKVVKLRRFLRHLIISAGKIHTSKMALSQVHNQLDRIKNVSDLEGSESDMHSEITKLRELLDTFVRTDKRLKGYHHEPPYSAYQDLNSRISNLDQKLALFMTLQEDRQAKFKKIEQKVKRGVETNKEKIDTIGNHIKKMEKEYARLEKTGKYSKKALDTLKRRLLSYKRKLRMVKNKK